MCNIDVGVGQKAHPVTDAGVPSVLQAAPVNAESGTRVPGVLELSVLTLWQNAQPGLCCSTLPLLLCVSAGLMQGWHPAMCGGVDACTSVGHSLEQRRDETVKFQAVDTP